MQRSFGMKCNECNNELVKRKKESIVAYAKRKYCSNACRHKAYKKLIKPVVIKLCPICKNPIERRKGMTPGKYNERQTCGSKDCMGRQIGNKLSGTHHTDRKPVNRKVKPAIIPKDFLSIKLEKPSFIAPISTWETVEMELDGFEDATKCKQCQERVANVYTGLCDVCVLPKIRHTRREYNHL
jgi:hypothetical protein